MESQFSFEFQRLLDTYEVVDKHNSVCKRSTSLSYALNLVYLLAKSARHRTLDGVLLWLLLSISARTWKQAIRDGLYCLYPSNITPFQSSQLIAPFFGILIRSPIWTRFRQLTHQFQNIIFSPDNSNLILSY